MLYRVLNLKSYELQDTSSGINFTIQWVTLQNSPGNSLIFSAEDKANINTVS